MPDGTNEQKLAHVGHVYRGRVSCNRSQHAVDTVLHVGATQQPDSNPLIGEIMKSMRQRASVLAVAIAASAGGIAIGNSVSATDYTSTVNAVCAGSHSERLSGSSWQYKGQISNCVSQPLYLRMDISNGP